jgi:hypothetical protein
MDALGRGQEIRREERRDSYWQHITTLSGTRGGSFDQKNPSALGN